ncbi:MAG: FAD-binding protein [Alphaproteobacteria bacterium]|nr:FAD-binding protein [Alphaproteobacteria bacterium]
MSAALAPAGRARNRSGRVGDSRLAARLARELEGEVLFDPFSRGRYATDASIYQIEPIGVVVPRRRADVEAAIAIAREEGVPVLPRGGGTSQCGQTVGEALVLDCSKHLNRVLAIDAEARTATVEPGLVLAHLNAALRKHGLFFPVDPSTHARCTLGGMAGNNSCGAKSIRYGLMADNVLAIEAILADGGSCRFAAQADNLGAAQTPPARLELVERLRALGTREAGEIAARFPRQLRRVGGYNIDALTPAARAAGRDNLARLLVGSEGTLGFFAALDLKLAPIKPRKVMGICQFPTFRKAMEAARHLVTLDPEAVELIDRTMIDLGRRIAIYRPTVDRMVQGEPQALLTVEFAGGEDGPLLAKLAELKAMMAELGHPGAVVEAVDAGFQAAIAEVREAGLNIMMSMKGDGKPVSFIEDCAVDLADLADYTERLEAVFRRHGTSGTWYAHASVGCLHVRPVLNMKDGTDVRRMRAIAEECFALVRDYKGSHSGEHGDGLVRSEFNEPMFGPRIARAFEAVKDAFDPKGLFNPGKIVRSPRMDDRSLFRYAPDYAPNHASLPFTPVLDWSEHPGPLGGFLGAVEMCNNNGTCRRADPGVMCPSYRVTKDEAHLTRGRANSLRLAITGQLGPDAIASDAMAETMKLCVSCKGCKRECPTGVDMARMKVEVLAARARRHGVPLKDKLIAHLPAYAPWAARFPGLMNLRDRLPGLAALSESLLGFSARRSLPCWRSDPFRDAEIAAFAPAPGTATGEAVLFVDCFTRYFEPGHARDALRVLSAAGVAVEIARPWDNGRALCCGRTYLAAGMVDHARDAARRMIASLLPAVGRDLPILGLEPSCLFTLRDEFPALLPGPEARAIADRAMLATQYLARESKVGRLALPLRPLAGQRALVHGHCHQKAFAAFEDTLACLRLVPGLAVEPIASSCCGMAGAFGYDADTIDVSLRMAELSLLPAVRAAGPGALIVADGTSCRHQIADGAGRPARHTLSILAEALRP